MKAKIFLCVFLILFVFSSVISFASENVQLQVQANEKDSGNSGEQTHIFSENDNSEDTEIKKTIFVIIPEGMEYEYNGKERKFEETGAEIYYEEDGEYINSFENDLFTVVSSERGTEEGTYKAELALTNPELYSWAMQDDTLDENYDDYSTYKIVGKENQTIEWKIIKISPRLYLSDEKISKEYNGKEHEIKLLELHEKNKSLQSYIDNGYIIMTGNKATQVGKYELTLTVKDTKNTDKIKMILMTEKNGKKSSKILKEENEIKLEWEIVGNAFSEESSSSQSSGGSSSGGESATSTQKTNENTVQQSSGEKEISKSGDRIEDNESISSKNVWENKYKDVKENEWYYEAVKFVSSNGIIKGISDEEFGISIMITRAMLVTALYRYDGEKEVSGENIFSDVDNNTYYAKAVLWAVENNIVNGTSISEFSPNLDITREQLIVIIYRFAKYQGFNVEQKTDLNKFEDKDLISDYAKDAFEWAVKIGLISGRTATTLAPQGTARRAEVATILMRFMFENSNM